MKRLCDFVHKKLYWRANPQIIAKLYFQEQITRKALAT
jgi:hypothetical protein